MCNNSGACRLFQKHFGTLPSVCEGKRGWVLLFSVSLAAIHSKIQQYGKHIIARNSLNKGSAESTLGAGDRRWRQCQCFSIVGQTDPYLSPIDT